jgi:hypothetical protein
MGFLSKLLGGDQSAEKAAKDLLNGLFGNASSQSAQQAASSQAQAPARAASPAAESGDSWGPECPAEENQFRYVGPYFGYFEKIFSEELPTFRFEKEQVKGSQRLVYTFYDGASKRLVVELMSDSCSPRKLRDLCAREGIPYLRFYYDHPGWWNTRSYVARRLHQAVSV